jgi:hypothetical protein
MIACVHALTPPSGGGPGSTTVALERAVRVLVRAERLGAEGQIDGGDLSGIGVDVRVESGVFAEEVSMCFSILSSERLQLRLRFELEVVVMQGWCVDSSMVAKLLGPRLKEIQMQKNIKPLSTIDVVKLSTDHQCYNKKRRVLRCK